MESQILVKSIDAENYKRDQHLLSDEFFNNAKFPTITFKSTQWEANPQAGEQSYIVHGKLTLLDKTLPVDLYLAFLGEGPGGQEDDYLPGWEAKTTINRQDWGISYGIPAVSADVMVEIQIEGRRYTPKKILAASYGYLPCCML